MSSTLPPPGGSDFTPPPSGTFPAICYRVIDLGTQQSSYMGEIKHHHKILVSWEIKDPAAVTEDGQPMSIHQNYTWSTHEKSNLRKDLESWRGRAFTDADFGAGGFDIRNILGVSCYIGITHVEKDGTVYANITSISQLPQGVNAGGLVNPLTFFWIEAGLFNAETMAGLSDNLQAKIKASPEYQLMTDGVVHQAAPMQPAAQAADPFQQPAPMPAQGFTQVQPLTEQAVGQWPPANEQPSPAPAGAAFDDIIPF